MCCWRVTDIAIEADMVSTNTFVADAAEGSRHLREATRQSQGWNRDALSLVVLRDHRRQLALHAGQVPELACVFVQPPVRIGSFAIWLRLESLRAAFVANPPGMAMKASPVQAASAARSRRVPMPPSPEKSTTLALGMGC